MFRRILLAVDLADEAETPKGLPEALELVAGERISFLAGPPTFFIAMGTALAGRGGAGGAGPAATTPRNRA